MAYRQLRAFPVAHGILVRLPEFDGPLGVAFQQISHCFQVLRSPEFNQAWAIYIQTSPQTFYDRLTASLPYDSLISFNINIDGTDYIRIKVVDGIREVAEADRTFSLTRREATKHAFVIWQPEDRGVGIARAVLKNTFSLFKDWGIKRVLCGAGLDDGALYVGQIWLQGVFS